MNWLDDRAIEVGFSKGKEVLFPLCSSELLRSFNTYCLPPTFRDQDFLSKRREPNIGTASDIGKTDTSFTLLR